MPLVWASSIITRARKEGRIRDDFAVKTMLDEINNFRGKCALLMHYDRISIPLVYTQASNDLFTYLARVVEVQKCATFKFLIDNVTTFTYLPHFFRLRSRANDSFVLHYLNH